MNSYSLSIKYGFIGGGIMIALMLLLYIISPTSLAGFIGLAFYMPLLFLMIWGGITARKQNGGYKNFGQAFATVFIISVIATMLFDSFGYLLFKVIDPDLPGLIKAKQLENTATMMEKFGSSDEQVHEALKRIEDADFTPTLKSQTIRYTSSIVFGLILSALIALFVNRPDGRPEVKTEA
jgi:hypothetical protein